MRTVSAAVNASILPVVQRTASLVEQALADAGLDVPLLVLRGDGGAMSVDAFRRRPCFTIGSGPAAGVAAALHQLGLADAIVVECGGTSSNVSVVKGGRPVVRSLRVMGRPTCVRAVDSWVVGAAGGSMALLKRRSVARPGPRSAHIAGLPYACFADPSELAGAQLELVAPRDGRSGGVRLRQGRRQALRADRDLRRQRARARRRDRVLVRGPGGGAGRVRPARRAAEDDAGGRRDGSCSTARSRRSSRRSRMPRASTTFGRTCHSSRSAAQARRSCRSSPSG